MSFHQDVGHNTRVIDIDLYRPQLAGCYVIQDGDAMALIDCGTKHSVERVMQTIDAMGGSAEQVRWIIPTHAHLDHAGGAGQLMAACPNAQLIAHPKGYQHMVDPSKLQAGATEVYGEAAFARDFGELLPIAEERCISAEDGQVFPLGERELTYIHTPGHANHHGCIFDSHSRYLFTGDTFGLGYREFAEQSPYIVATTTPVAFDPDGWFDSLKKMMALQPQAVCLTHYGRHDNPQSMLDMLQASIEAHRQIALDEESQPLEGRHQRLLEAVDALLTEGAQKHCGMAADQARELLAGDIELNAQGLGVWLMRRAKKRERDAAAEK